MELLVGRVHIPKKIRQPDRNRVITTLCYYISRLPLVTFSYILWGATMRFENRSSCRPAPLTLVLNNVNVSGTATYVVRICHVVVRDAELVNSHHSLSSSRLLMLSLTLWLRLNDSRSWRAVSFGLSAHTTAHEADRSGPEANPFVGDVGCFRDLEHIEVKL